MGPTEVILVTGATGRQGQAFIKALYAFQPQEINIYSRVVSYHVLALTRTPDSPSSQRLLASYPSTFLSLVQGNLNVPSSIRKIFADLDARKGVTKGKSIGDNPKIWSVFCILPSTGPGKNADREESQGKLLIDLANEWGVEHFVYSSAERGGEVDDRMAKVRIERYLTNKGPHWTILRPGFFMENFGGKLGSIIFGVLKAGLKPSTKLQLVAASDIGVVGASVIHNPFPYLRKTLLVVGDTLTVDEIEESYKKGSGGKKMSGMNRLLAKLLIRMNGFANDLIVGMERVGADLRAIPFNEPNLAALVLIEETNPGMTKFEEWVRQEHDRTEEREKAWNWQIMVGSSVTGKS